MATSPYDDLESQLDELLTSDPLTYEAEGYVAGGLGGSAMAGVRPDAEAEGGQQQALRELLGIVDAGGITGQDRERIAERQALDRMAGRGAEQAYAQDLSERGLSGGASDVMGAQMGAQGQIQAQASQDRELQAAAQARALAAMSQAGAAGSQLRGQSYDEAARRAEGADRIARANADAMNSARQFTAQQRNAASLQNAYAPDRAFGMRSQIATGKAKGLQADIDRQRATAQQQRETEQGYYKAAGGLVTGIMSGGNPAATSAGASVVGAGFDDDDEDA